MNLKPEIYGAILDGATELRWFCNQCETIVNVEPSSQTTKLDELTKLLEKFLERTNLIELKLGEKADSRTVSMLEKSMSVLEERLYRQAQARVSKSEMILEQRLAGLDERISKYTTDKTRTLEEKLDKLSSLVDDTRRDKTWTDMKVKRLYCKSH